MKIWYKVNTKPWPREMGGRGRQTNRPSSAEKKSSWKGGSLTNRSRKKYGEKIGQQTKTNMLSPNPAQKKWTEGGKKKKQYQMKNQKHMIWAKKKNRSCQKRFPVGEIGTKGKPNTGEKGVQKSKMGQKNSHEEVIPDTAQNEKLETWGEKDEEEA